MNTAERLGFDANAKLLIINADDFGVNHSANAGIFQLLEEGAVDSATVMMPCGWAREAVRWSAERPHLDVGVHFTLTSEWEPYKWGPVSVKTDVSSLVTEEMVFPADIETVERQADPAHVRAELIAQVEMAKSMGLDPTHLDNHMGSVYGLKTGRHFLREVFEVCVQYGLPFRLPRHLPQHQAASPELAAMAKQLTAAADQLGIVILDHLTALPYQAMPGETYDRFKNDMIQLLTHLQPGVTELFIHPAEVTEELKAMNPHWEKRGWEMEIFRDPDVLQAMQDAGIQRIKWSDLRNLQRRDR